jgi:hypothetical protein
MDGHDASAMAANQQRTTISKTTQSVIVLLVCRADFEPPFNRFRRVRGAVTEMKRRMIVSLSVFSAVEKRTKAVLALEKAADFTSTRTGLFFTQGFGRGIGIGGTVEVLQFARSFTRLEQSHDAAILLGHKRIIGCTRTPAG